jgi:hypothetical protein
LRFLDSPKVDQLDKFQPVLDGMYSSIGGRSPYILWGLRQRGEIAIGGGEIANLKGRNRLGQIIMYLDGTLGMRLNILV